MPTEKHPLKPFLPQNAKVLMLGSFPPKREKWSMEFFYPNWINDMWRIMGLLFFGNKAHFELPGERRFCYDKVVGFCIDKGIALYDTATEVNRLKDNASDKFLQVVTPTDIKALLLNIPECGAIVTTGQKATDIVVETFGCEEPKVGSMTMLSVGVRAIRFWRMPSSSRAYPLSLDKKAECYRGMFCSEGLIPSDSL